MVRVPRVTSLASIAHIQITDTQETQDTRTQAHREHRYNPHCILRDVSQCTCTDRVPRALAGRPNRRVLAATPSLRKGTMQGQIGHDRLCFCCLHCALACICFVRASHRIIVLGLLARVYFWYKHIPFTLASTSVISFLIPSLPLVLW